MSCAYYIKLMQPAAAQTYEPRTYIQIERAFFHLRREQILINLFDNHVSLQH